MQFYHGSRSLIENNEILHIDSSNEDCRYTEDDVCKDLEDLFEMYKPDHCFSRRDSIFMAGDPEDIDNLGGYTDFIYKVTPTETPQKSDLHWYTKVSSRTGDFFEIDDISDLLIIEMINNYWNGTASDNPCFEYRCLSAKVDNEIDDLNV